MLVDDVDDDVVAGVEDLESCGELCVGFEWRSVLVALVAVVVVAGVEDLLKG